MRKIYPYLQEAYSPNLNEEQEKRNFLALLDDFINQRQYINMTLLDWEENPLQEIEGIISSGSINKDGASSVRRTCSLSCSVDGESYNVDSLDMLFSLNKKIFIEIGIKNETDKYRYQKPESINCSNGSHGRNLRTFLTVQVIGRRFQECWDQNCSLHGKRSKL